jgi:hypothetical protein
LDRVEAQIGAVCSEDLRELTEVHRLVAHGAKQELPVANLQFAGAEEQRLDVDAWELASACVELVGRGEQQNIFQCSRFSAVALPQASELAVVIVGGDH